MAQDALDPETARQTPRREGSGRLRDISVVVAGAMAVLLLLAASGQLGWVEAATAGVVIATGSAAYYNGTVSPPQPRQRLVDLKSDRPAKGSIDLAVAIDAMPAPVLHVNSDGRVDTANADARTLFRVDPKQKTLASAVFRDPALLEAVDAALETGRVQTVEFKRPDGADQVWLSHIRSIKRAGGGVLVIFEDKSEIRRAEKARADFLANASHELRTPLTSVAGFIETLRGTAKDDQDSWDRFLEIMSEQTDRMQRLIADLLSLSRIEFSEHRPPDTVHDVASIVTRATQALVPIATERDIALTLDAPSGEALAIVDADELIQAVQNLVTNAVKYSPDGGHVAVELGAASSLDTAKEKAGRRWETGARMTLLEAPRNEATTALFVRVTDEGQGIPPAHLPRLGQRFYRVDPARSHDVPGTGLGLAIVKHIMTRHRGGFIVESEEGKGSGFGIWLPALGADPSDSSKRRNVADETVGPAEPVGAEKS